MPRAVFNPRLYEMIVLYDHSHGVAKIVKQLRRTSCWTDVRFMGWVAKSACSPQVAAGVHTFYVRGSSRESDFQNLHLGDASAAVIEGIVNIVNGGLAGGFKRVRSINTSVRYD